MDNVYQLRPGQDPQTTQPGPPPGMFDGPPVDRPALDAVAAKLRAEGLIGNQPPTASTSENTSTGGGPAAITGEVLAPLRTGPGRRIAAHITAASEEDLIPLWLRSGDVAKARIKVIGRRAGRAGAWYALHSPLIVWNLIPPTARGLGKGIRAWWRWVQADAIEARAVQMKEVNKTTWDEWLTKANRARKARAWMTVLGLPVSLGAVWIGDIAYGPLVPTVVVGSLLAAAAAAGRREGETFLPGSVPDSPIELGMPLKLLNSTVADVLAELKLQVTVLRSIAHTWGWDVEIMAGQSTEAIERKLDEIEPRLRTRRGAVSVITDRADAGRATIRIVYSDPFAKMPPPAPKAPRSISIKSRHQLGKRLDGGPLQLSLLAHTGVIGKSGSGKSSALWTDLDLLTAASDVIVFGIDLSDGPAINIWGDCITAYATTPSGAEGLFKYLIAIAQGRASLMGKRLRPTADSNPDDDVDENWTVTDREPAYVLVVDEYPLVAEAGLTPLMETFLRIARKTAGFAHIASQRAGRNEMGTTTVKAMITNKMLLACESGDVDMFLGPGLRAQGWRPDRLQPATPGNPNDAGRCYVQAPGLEDPQLSAVLRIDAKEARKRAIERMRHIKEHGRPTFDQATLEKAERYALSSYEVGLAALLRGEGSVLASDLQLPDEPAVPLPALLVAIRAVFATDAAARLSTVHLLQRLADADERWDSLTSTELADQLRPYGVRPGGLRNYEGHPNVNGYKFADVENAIKGISGAA